MKVSEALRKRISVRASSPIQFLKPLFAIS